MSDTVVIGLGNVVLSDDGLGVHADIDGKTVLVGSHSFLTQRGIDTQPWEVRAETWRAVRRLLERHAF